MRTIRESAPAEQDFVTRSARQASQSHRASLARRTSFAHRATWARRARTCAQYLYTALGPLAACHLVLHSALIRLQLGSCPHLHRLCLAFSAFFTGGRAASSSSSGGFSSRSAGCLAASSSQPCSAKGSGLDWNKRSAG